MKTEKSAFTIPSDLFSEAKQAAKDRDMNYSAFVVHCIRAALHGEASIPPVSDDIRDLRRRVTDTSENCIMNTEAIDSLEGRVLALEKTAGTTKPPREEKS